MRQSHILLKGGPRLDQLFRLGPIVESSCDKDLRCGMLPVAIQVSTIRERLLRVRESDIADGKGRE